VFGLRNGEERGKEFEELINLNKYGENSLYA